MKTQSLIVVIFTSLMILSAVIASPASANSSEIIHQEVPDDSVSMQDIGDTFSFEINVSETSEINEIELLTTAEATGDSTNANIEIEFRIDDEVVGGDSDGGEVTEGEEYDLEFSDTFNKDVSNKDQVTIELVVESGSGSLDNRISDSAFSDDGATVWGLGAGQVENPEPNDGRFESPTELSVDVVVADTDVVFESGDGEEIGILEAQEGETASVEWDFDQSDIDDDGQVSWSAKADGNEVEASFIGTEESSSPELNNPEPASGEILEETPVELSIDVSDDDFETVQGDRVEVEFYDDEESLIGSDTVDSDQTVSVEDEPVAGDNSWYVVAEDDYGNTVESDTFTYQTPENLEIRNETDPDELVTTDAEVEVQFFAGEEVITRSTTDGIVNLAGLPADEPMTIQVEADGYITRQSVVDSILDQQDVYLLPDDVDSVETTFLLDDRTGEFARDRTRIIVEKPITRDGETTYQTVVSDQSGPSGYSTVLERDSRYRLAIINEETEERRVLGPYVTTSSETVNLEVDEVQFDSGGTDIGYEWRADYINESSPSVRFDFQAEPDREIRDFELRITSRDGETELINESYGSVDSVSETVTIPDEIEDPGSQTWEVEWTAETDDGDEVTAISGGEVVGPDQMPVELPGVADYVLHVVSVLIILLVAGLFSSANVTVGGIVTSLTAGGLWFVGATPPGVTGMFIATGLFVSIIAHLRTNQQVRPA